MCKGSVHRQKFALSEKSLLPRFRCKFHEARKKSTTVTSADVLDQYVEVRTTSVPLDGWIPSQTIDLTGTARIPKHGNMRETS